MPNGTILIVEDETKIVEILRDYLLKADYEVEVLGRGDPVVSYVRETPPALILLDLMIPGMDGMSVCREVRKFSPVPIIMVTARVEEIDRLLGLELGADDYICKPFSPREVVARVRAVLRRYVPEETGGKGFTVGPLSLDSENRLVFISGKELKLTRSEYGLLEALIGRPNRIFSRSELIDTVQGYSFEGYDRTIDTHIKNLRKKIAVELPGMDIISTVYGMGYRLNAPPELREENGQGD